MELECGDLEETLAEEDGPRKVVMGDVCGSLRDLQLSVERHFKDVMQLLDSSEACLKPKSICSLLRKIENLGGKPVWVTSCSNTAGFKADKAGRVVKAKPSSQHAASMPKRCFFVSVEIPRTDHILLVSPDGNTRLKCCCLIDWSAFISGLHCYSRRQLLYIGQQLSITVTDLSGSVIRVIDADRLERPVSYLCGPCGNGDKVFFFDQAERKVLGVDADTGALQTVVGVESFYETKRKVLESLSIVDRTLFMTDYAKGQVHKLSSINGSLRSSYPTPRSELPGFRYPSDVLATNNGLVIICELKQHVVRIMSNDGAVLQTLGESAGEDGCGVGCGGGDELRGPHSLSVLMCENDEEQLLCVADREAGCLSLYTFIE